MTASPSSRHDYADQAARYDRTRGASPSIFDPIRDALAAAPGRRLVDVAGGTGNYAGALRDLGWKPVVVDVSHEMLERARLKGLPALRGSAARLPIADGSVDAVVNISALHLIADWQEALHEARRALGAGGRLALMTYTRENLDVHWIFDYFPDARRWVDREHQTLHEIMAELPGAHARPFEFSDLEDASMSALCRYPELLLDPAWRLQTSFFERLEREDPGGLARGLAHLEADLKAGRRPDHEVAPLRRRYGDGTIIAWTKTG
jgi:ubiquinone/menaquinone biosynthesis C-methylase UbiE